jgi:CarD family transcriptional regulator
MGSPKTKSGSASARPDSQSGNTKSDNASSAVTRPVRSARAVRGKAVPPQSATTKTHAAKPAATKSGAPSQMGETVKPAGKGKAANGSPTAQPQPAGKPPASSKTPVKAPAATRAELASESKPTGSKNDKKSSASQKPPAPPAAPVKATTATKNTAGKTASVTNATKTTKAASAAPEKSPAPKPAPRAAAQSQVEEKAVAKTESKAKAPAKTVEVAAPAANQTVVKALGSKPSVSKPPVAKAPVATPSIAAPSIAATPVAQVETAPEKTTPAELGAVEAARTAEKPAAPKPAPRVAAPKDGDKPASGAHRTGFKSQEFIVYPAHGVGQIIAIEEQEVAGFKLELFVINFAKDKMTLKVPLPKVLAGAIRKLSDEATVKKALETLTGRARVKRTMWSRRAQEYEAKINSGDLIAIAEVVRDLYRSDAQPEQSYSERQLYEAAVDRMARELAAVRQLTETESMKVVEQHLERGPKRGPRNDSAVDGDGDGDPDTDGPDGEIDAAA